MFNLKLIREFEGFSMNEIANKLNVSKSTYAGWESNKDIIPLKHLINLANVYQVNIDFLLGITKTRINTLELKVIDIKKISETLKSYRNKLGMTQEQLGKELHISKYNISRYENTKLLISTSCLFAFSKKYGISTDYFLGFSNKEKIN